MKIPTRANRSFVSLPAIQEQLVGAFSSDGSIVLPDLEETGVDGHAIRNLLNGRPWSAVAFSELVFCSYEIKLLGPISFRAALPALMMAYLRNSADPESLPTELAAVLVPGYETKSLLNPAYFADAMRIACVDGSADVAESVRKVEQFLIARDTGDLVRTRRRQVMEHLSAVLTVPQRAVVGLVLLHFLLHQRAYFPHDEPANGLVYWWGGGTLQ